MNEEYPVIDLSEHKANPAVEKYAGRLRVTMISTSTGPYSISSDPEKFLSSQGGKVLCAFHNVSPRFFFESALRLEEVVKHAQKGDTAAIIKLLG